MSVYVDPLFKTRGAGRRWPFKEACHMFADSLDELHAMAARIGLKRQWFQNKDRLPHYDLTASKRGLAVYHGAIQVDCRRMVKIMDDRPWDTRCQGWNPDPAHPSMRCTLPRNHAGECEAPGPAHVVTWPTEQSMISPRACKRCVAS